MLSDKDIEHLQWIYDRMHFVYGNSENIDYMQRFMEIINKLKNPVGPSQITVIKRAFNAGTSYATYNGRPGFPDAPNFDEWLKQWKNHG